MTQKFIDTLTKYNNQFVSSENPMSFIAMINFETMTNLMNKALEQNEQLDFDYNYKNDDTIPDDIVVKIADKIVY
jgi:hypothetical protein